MAFILFYTTGNTPRLQYIVHFLSQYFSCNFQLTTDTQLFKNNATAKINYSPEKLTDNEIWIKPWPLLYQNGIEPVKIDCFTHPKKFTAFFRTDDDVGFDLFAAIFYLISRYEEYLPHQKDMYGRYAHQNSAAYKNNFLHLPLVNIWLQDFRETLLQKFSSLSLQKHKFTFVPTYDIDMAWSYRNKGWWRNWGGLIKEITTGKLNSASQRVKVLVAHKPDPFDAFDWLQNLHHTYGLQALYFFLVAQQTSAYDKNISPHVKALQALIKKVAQVATVGVHPSWQSGDDQKILHQEITLLSFIINEPVKTSRQHFIRFTLPQTFRQLIAAAITDDYSMGYGSINGFRASVASSFFWYDLEQEEETTLCIHPFCFMDANAYYEQKLTPEQALEELQHYTQIVQVVGGTLITIWHNSFLGTASEFSGWRQVYQQFIEGVTSK